MAKDRRGRQKAMARKAAKRKARAQRHRHKGGPPGALPTPEAIAGTPVHECLVPDNLFELGIGNVVVSRRLPGGDIALGVFLVDTQCLGVKNAMFKVVTPHEYREITAKISGEHGVRVEDPAAVKKLVKGAVAWARDLGIEPHPDYRRARRVLAGIDVSACPVEYTYGYQGKPFYRPGPYDPPGRQKKILQLLERRCGPDGYRFMIPLLGEHDDPDEWLGPAEEP